MVTNVERKQVRGRVAIPRVGQFYRNVDGQVFILAQVEQQKVSLISLRDGNRWAAPVEVGDITRLTAEEWKAVCAEEKFDRQ